VTRRIERLVGIYDADGGAVGELRYALRRLVGRTHCTLCDITHGTMREKAAWRTFRAGLPVPFDVVHLNERTEPVRQASASGTPCVLAQAAGDLVLLLGPTDLDACAGDVSTFAGRLREAALAADLTY